MKDYRGEKTLNLEELLADTPPEFTDKDLDWFIPLLHRIIVDVFKNEDYRKKVQHQIKLKHRREKYRAKKAKQNDGHG